MTNQLQGEILFQGWSGGYSPGDEVNWAYTPWMPVRGDLATFGVQVVNANSMTLTWEVQTRTLEDPATVSTITTPVVTSASGTLYAMATVGPGQQLVRYRFSTGSGATTANWMVLRALQPSWQVDR